jgi:hypothetical protein
MPLGTRRMRRDPLARALGAVRRVAHARCVQPADAELLERELALPGLGWMLDPTPLPAAIAEALGARGLPRVEALRYQPGRRAIASLAFPEMPARLYARTLDAPRAHKRGPDYERSGARIWSERELALFAFPRDLELPSLAYLVEPNAGRRAARELSLPALRGASLELIRYRPERRAVFRADASGAGAALKHYARREYARSRRAVEHARAGEALALAAPLACSDSERLIAFEWRREAPLRGAIAAGSLAPRHFETLALALAELHAQIPPDAAARTAPAERIADAFAAARHFLPRAETRIAAIAARIEQRLAGPAPAALTHGDFYDKQVLLGDAAAVLLDLDQAAPGDAHEDAGCFLAHLVRDATLGRLARTRADSARGAWRDACAGVWRAPRFEAARAAAWEALGLLRLVPYPFRIRHPDWSAAADALLGDAEAALAT